MEELLAGVHRWVNLSNKHRDIALYVEIGFGALSWPIISIMNESQYKDLGALRDCKSLNFVKKTTGLRPLI